MRREGVKLRQSLLARNFRHPRQNADIGVIGLQQILHELVGLGLGFRWEVFGDINLAERFADGIIEQMHASCSAVELLCIALNHRAVEGKVGIIKALGQVSRERVQIVHSQIVTPHRHRRRRENLGEQRKRTLLRHDDLALAVRRGQRDVGLGKECIPREFWSKFLQVRNGHRIVDLVLIAAVLVGPLHLRDLNLERVDFGRARIGVRGAGERQHLGEVFLVGFLRGHDFLVGLQIVVAVGHAEAALIQVDRIGVRILVIRADADIVDTSGLAPDRTHGARDIRARFQMGEIVEVRLHRREAVRFDLLLIHEGVVEVSQLLLFVVELVIRLGFQLGHDLAHLFFALDAQILEGARAGAVRRNLRRLHPASVDVQKEVVTGLHTLIHGGEVDAPRAILRVAGLIGGRANREGRAEQCAEHKQAASRKWTSHHETPR